MSYFFVLGFFYLSCLWVNESASINAVKIGAGIVSSSFLDSLEKVKKERKEIKLGVGVRGVAQYTCEKCDRYFVHAGIVTRHIENNTSCLQAIKAIEMCVDRKTAVSQFKLLSNPIVQPSRLSHEHRQEVIEPVIRTGNFRQAIDSIDKAQRLTNKAIVMAVEFFCFSCKTGAFASLLVVDRRKFEA